MVLFFLMTRRRMPFEKKMPLPFFTQVNSNMPVIAKPAVSEEGQSGLKQEWTGEGGVRMLLFEWQEAGQRSSLSLSRLGPKEI